MSPLAIAAVILGENAPNAALAAQASNLHQGSALPLHALILS